MAIVILTANAAGFLGLTVNWADEKGCPLSWTFNALPFMVLWLLAIALTFAGVLMGGLQRRNSGFWDRRIRVFGIIAAVAALTAAPFIYIFRFNQCWS